jgi:hypothetical protein
MSRDITVWLDDEEEQALALLRSTGLAESDAVRKAIIEAAAHTNVQTLVSDPYALELALDKSHNLVAEILATQRPPR